MVSHSVSALSDGSLDTFGVVILEEKADGTANNISDKSTESSGDKTSGNPKWVHGANRQEPNSDSSVPEFGKGVLGVASLAGMVEGLSVP